LRNPPLLPTISAGVFACPAATVDRVIIAVLAAQQVVLVGCAMCVIA
jgi:hypothetical protein